MPRFHGLKFTESTGGTRPVSSVSSAVIGMVCAADDADAVAYPLNTPVLLTDVRGAIGKAGDDGDLAPSLQAISDQTNPVVIVVRVEEGDDPAERAANIIGSNVGPAPTGLQALLTAKASLGISPRILGVPGFDSQAVTAATAILAQKLRGFAYAGCADADTVAEAVTYKNQFGQRELMLIYPGFTNGQNDGLAIARALGLRARIDQEVGWHKTLSNVPVNGVTGLSRPVFFDMQDPASDAGVLNNADITALINQNGYRFWGNRTCSADPLWAFESSVRTNWALRDIIDDSMRWAADLPLHPSIARDILETANAAMRDLKAQGRIIDGEAWLEPSENTQASLAAGQLHVTIDFTDVPPLEGLGITTRKTDKYLATFVNQVGAAG